MAKTDNLGDFLKDVADSIRTKTGTTELINAQDFSDKILSIQTGGGENTLKKLLDATKSCYYLFYKYSGTSVDDLIQPSDTENVTTMRYMFNNCTNLTTIPQFNTSKVTDMNNIFYFCKALTSIPQLDTSNVTAMNSMFYSCKALTSIPLLDTSKVTFMNSMFTECSNLTSIPQLNTSKVTDMNGMFYGCSSLTTIPQLDTSNVTFMWGMFNQCTQLTTVPSLDVDKVADFGQMFLYCPNLKSILMTNIGADLNISDSTKFEREDLLIILNNLKTVTSATTLTMGATNLAKLTDEDKAIAINKGWTLA